MSKGQMLRALVKQRLSLAAEEIFDLFERTIAEYEEQLCRSKEENERQRKLLDAVFKPQLRLHRAGVQQLSLSKEEVPPEQQDQSSSLDQEDPPELPHIKEEQEELCTNQEEADVTVLAVTPAPVKSEDDEEEKPQSSQLLQIHAEQMETEADGEDCGEPEPARTSESDGHLQPETENQNKDSSETEVSDGDWEATREPQSDLNNPSSESITKASGGKKPFSCSDCGKRFRRKTYLTTHMRIHTGERPFSCSVCTKRFSHKVTLKNHMARHTGEKPFSCSECGKRCSRKASLSVHMVVHTGEKRFGCKVCDRRFTFQSSVKRHKCVGGQSSQLHQRQTEQMETEADGGDCRGPEPARNSDPDGHLEPETEERCEGFCISECPADLQQLLVSNVEDPPEQQDPSELPHIKQEQEELLTNQEEVDVTKFTFTSVALKREDDDEEKPQSSHPHRRQAERMETEADVDDCGEPEPARNFDPDGHLQPETEASDDLEEMRDPEPDSNDSDSLSLAAVDAGKKRFSCSDCGKSFGSKTHLQNHTRTHTGERPFGCLVCGKRFTQKGNLTQHMTLHTGEKPFSCSVCDRRFTLPSYVKRHKCVGRQSSQLYQRQTGQVKTEADGEDCGGPEPARNSDPDGHFQPETKDSYETEDSIADWKETREPQSALNQVDSEGLMRFDHVENHTRAPTGDRLFGCSVCGEQFTQKENLTSHLTLHTAKRQLSCPECLKEFAYMSALQTHMWIHSGERPHSCSICGRRFIQKGNLKQHMTLHTGEKRYSCSVCDRRFTWLKQLKNHQCDPSETNQEGPEPAQDL